MITIALQTKEIIAITISLMITAVILPLGLGLIANAGNVVIGTEGSEGHYLGTYSFTNEAEGTSGTDIGFIDTITHQDPNTIAQIKNSISSHNKVLEIDDNNATGYIEFSNSFTSRGFGTIEFWVRFTEKSVNDIYFKLDIVILALRSNKWYYRDYDPDQWVLVPNVNDPVLNTWTHIKLDWRSTGGSAYKGMSINTGRYTIDSISSGNIGTDDGLSFVSKLEIKTTNAYNGTVWIDAVGYVWDSDYNEGDNKKTTTYVYLINVVDPIVLTLLTVLIPLFVVIGIAMSYIEKFGKK